MKSLCFISKILILIFFAALTVNPLYGKDDKARPKDPGVYVKTDKSLVRLLPNMVFDEEGFLYIESNKPKRFALKDIEYFVIFGKYEMSVLTLNPLLFFKTSPVGKPQFIFGKNNEINVINKGADLYIIKPKILMGRGYFCLWIEDTVWDFVIE